MYKELIESARRVLGPQHPGTLVAMSTLAMVLNDEKRFADAEKLYREVLEAQRQTLGPEHASTLLTMGNLGFVLIQEKNYSEAEKVLREALAGLRRVLGPSHEVTADAAHKLARVLALEGKRDEAFVNLRAYADALDLCRRHRAIWKKTTISNLCMETRASTRSWPPHASASPRLRRSRSKNRLRIDHPT